MPSKMADNLGIPFLLRLIAIYTEAAMADDGVTVTENEPREHRPDNTKEQEAAEIRVQETIKDLDSGLVTKRSAVNVKNAAERAIGGHDLNRGLRNLP